MSLSRLFNSTPRRLPIIRTPASRHSVHVVPFSPHSTPPRSAPPSPSPPSPKPSLPSLPSPAPPLLPPSPSLLQPTTAYDLATWYLPARLGLPWKCSLLSRCCTCWARPRARTRSSSLTSLSVVMSHGLVMPPRPPPFSPSQNATLLRRPRYHLASGCRLPPIALMSWPACHSSWGAGERLGSTRHLALSRSTRVVIWTAPVASSPSKKAGPDQSMPGSRLAGMSSRSGSCLPSSSRRSLRRKLALSIVQHYAWLSRLCLLISFLRPWRYAPPLQLLG